MMLGGIGDAFADRNFRIYSLGNIISWLSFFVQLVAVSWTTWELTHSTGCLAIIAVLDIAPNIVFVPLAGVLADRTDRFRIVVVTHIFALLQALALSLLAFTGHLTIVPLAVLSFLHGLIHSFSVPGLYGMMPRFVARERLASAIAVNSAYSNFAIFAGPALAGWIILHFGVSVAYASNVVGYAVYLVSIAFLRTPSDYVAPPPSRRSVGREMLDGIRYILDHQGISALLLLMVVGDGLSAAVRQMLPAVADGFGAGVTGMSGLLSAIGLGATASALWMAQGGLSRASPGRVISASVIQALCVALLVLTSGFVVALLIMAVYGVAGELRRTGTISLIQIAVDDRRRGRVMSTQFLLQRVAGAIGTTLIGTAAEHGGLRVPLMIGASVATIVGGVALAKKQRIAAAFARPEAA